MKTTEEQVLDTYNRYVGNMHNTIKDNAELLEIKKAILKRLVGRPMSWLDEYNVILEARDAVVDVLYELCKKYLPYYSTHGVLDRIDKVSNYKKIRENHIVEIIIIYKCLKELEDTSAERFAKMEKHAKELFGAPNVSDN